MGQQAGGISNLENIYVILVKPQMGENIGAVARAMLNFNIRNLRIVNPRDGWPNEKAITMSVGAKSVVENAEIFDSFADACADINLTYAATARLRNMNKPVLTPKLAASDIFKNIGQKIAIVIGPENFGLSNEDVANCNKIITVPVNESFSSINISQATGIICYEIFSHSFDRDDYNLNQDQQLASGKEIELFYQHLERELLLRGFFRVEHMKEVMQNNLRGIFKRVDNFTSQDVRTLRGIIKSLTN
jgi:tRNA/rRNA methyltransferase